MRRTAAPWLVLLLALARPSAVFAERYDMDLAFDPVSSTLHGTAVISFDPDEVRGGAFLLLYNNLLSRRNPHANALLEDIAYARGFSPGFTKVTTVADADGRAIPFAAADSPLLPKLVTYPVRDFVLRLDLPADVADQERRISVRFTTRLPPMLSGDETSLGGAFVQRFLWFPKLGANGSAFTIDSFQYAARITVPSGWQLISSGREKRTGDTWSLDSDGVPRAGIPVAIVRTGTLEESRLETPGRVLRAFAKPAHRTQAKKSLAFAASALTHYEGALGTLPEGPITIVEGASDGLWGMTGDGFILLGRGAFTADLVLPRLLDPLLDFLVSHEVAHLWFGIGAGTDFIAENWLSESLAQYASVAWIEEKRGALENYFEFPDGIGGEALRLLLPWNSQRDSMAENILSLRKSGRDFPLLAPPDRQNINGYAAVLYDRGAMAMRQLRLEAGAERFDDALRAYCEQYRGRTGGTEAFLETLEGQSPGITPAAMKILDTTSYPDYAVDRIEATPQGSVVSFTDKAASGLVSMAVITTDRETVPVRLEGRTSVSVEGTVRSVAIDPLWSTLDTDRRNNSWPRRLTFPLPTGSPFDADTLAPALGLQLASASDGSTLVGLSAAMRYSTVGMASFSAEAGVLPVVSIGPDGLAGGADAYASLSLGLPRSLGLDAWVAGSGGAWRAGSGLSHTIWFRTATGAPSPLFTPALTWSVSAAVDQDATITPAASVDIEGLYAPLPFLLHIGAAGALGFPDGAAFLWADLETAVRVEAETTVFLRLLPRLYVVPVVDAALGFPVPGSGIVPGRLRAGDASRGDGRGYLGLDLLFPIANGLEVRLANVAILRSVYGGLYAEAEDVFTGMPTAFVLSPDLWDLHAGIQVGVTLTTLGGAAFPLAAGIDVAVSQLAWGAVSWGAALRLFLSAHVPTGFYGLTLTW